MKRLSNVKGLVFARPFYMFMLGRLNWDGTAGNAFCWLCSSAVGGGASGVRPISLARLEVTQTQINTIADMKLPITYETAAYQSIKHDLSSKQSEQHTKQECVDLSNFFSMSLKTMEHRSQNSDLRT